MWSNTLQLTYTNLFANFKLRSDNNFHLDIELGTFEVEDNYTLSTAFKKILWKKRAEKESKLLQVSVESSPSDGKADLALSIRLQEIDIVVNLPLIQRIRMLQRIFYCQ